MSLMRFILGYKIFCADQVLAPEILNICSENAYVYSNVKFEGGKIFFECSLAVSKKIKKSCGDAGIELEVFKVCGIPSIFYRYRHRYGIFVGIFIFFLTVFLSGRVIWDVRIEGNSRLSDSFVISELDRCGLAVGDLRKNIDATLIENRVMIESDDISWISINIIGTVAQVEIRESEFHKEEEHFTSSNIVAKEDGFIYLFEDVRGNILLKIGDFVRKGDLIVSGLYDSENQGMRYTEAKGKVLAKTSHSFSVEIPLKYSKKVYTGRDFCEKYFIFFGKEIKFYSNSGNLHTNCDTIDVREYAHIFSFGSLPFGIRKVKKCEYVYADAFLSEDEAQKICSYSLNCKLQEVLGKGELLSKSVRFENVGGRIIGKCKIRCIEDIAEKKEIIIDGI